MSSLVSKFEHQLQIKTNLNESNELNKKLDKHKLLIEKFSNKKCVYIFEMEEGVYIKIGSTQDIKNKHLQLKKLYKNCIILDVFETN